MSKRSLWSAVKKSLEECRGKNIDTHAENVDVLSCSRLYQHTGKTEKNGEKVVEENTHMMRVSSSVSALVWKASCTCKGEDGSDVRGS
jgi:hypothetical protein